MLSKFLNLRYFARNSKEIEEKMMFKRVSSVIKGQQSEKLKEAQLKFNEYFSAEVAKNKNVKPNDLLKKILESSDKDLGINEDVYKEIEEIRSKLESKIPPENMKKAMDFLNKILNRPPNERPFLLIPIGYPAEDATVPDIKRKNKEQTKQETAIKAEKERKNK